MFDKNLMMLEGMRGIMAALVLLALLQAGCIAGWAFGLSRAVCALWDGVGMQEALPYLVLFASCFIVLQIARFAQEVMLDKCSLAQAQELRDRLMLRVFDARSLLSVRAGAARVASVANDGIDEVQTYLRVIPPKIVGMVAISVPLLACEFVADWPSGIILAVMFPVIIFFMGLLGRQARDRSERQYAAYTRLTNRFMDTLRGLPVLKAFGASRSEAQRVYANGEGVRQATVRTLRTATLSSAVLDLCATFGVAAVAIMLAFRLMDGSLPLVVGLFALVVAPEYFAPIRSFASDYHASLDGKNSLAAILGYLDESEDAEPCSAASDAHLEDFRRIDVEDAGYRYPDGNWGVRHVGFHAERGEKIGIVGASGAGKSTLVNLLVGISEPTEGRILVNGNQVDLGADAWKRQVRYIPQSPYVFRATLEENIRLYQPRATRAEVEAAARAVGLGGLVSALPNGLDTMVGEGARGLSGGEAHRVALARILVDDAARVLVFDEPTAHLDIETERDLKQPMLDAMEGKLVLFATHRLHWIADMDRVVELEPSHAANDAAGSARVEGGVPA